MASSSPASAFTPAESRGWLGDCSLEGFGEPEGVSQKDRRVEVVPGMDVGPAGRACKGKVMSVAPSRRGWGWPGKSNPAAFPAPR